MMTKTLDDYDTLGFLDKKGFDFEMENLTTLEDLAKQYGFRITYHNPKEPHKWKRTKGFGTDLTLEVENLEGYTYRIHTEESFQSRPYHYRRSWFFNSRLSRFKNKPHGRFDIWVLLVNQTYNFNGLTQTAKKVHVHIFNLNQLVDCIKRLSHSTFRRKFGSVVHSAIRDAIPSPSAIPYTVTVVPDTVTSIPIVNNHSNNDTTRTNNVYAYSNKMDIDRHTVSSNPVIALLQEARRIKLWSESVREHGLNPDN